MCSRVVFKQPALYDGVNEVTKRDAKQALDKYLHLLRWREGESILDVGSGSGNVTTQILATRLPADYKLLVGLDISPNNVNYAADNYSDPRIIYLQGDIVEPDFQILEERFTKQNIIIGFDKVFSFHCLDWTNNSAQWSKNIYALLKPGGQTLLVFFTKNTIVEMLNEVAFSDKWCRYTKAVGPFRNEFHDTADVDGDLTKMMTKAGFVVESCEHYLCYYDNNWPFEDMCKLLQSTGMYVHNVPEKLHSEYFEDIFSTYAKYREEYNDIGVPFTVSVIVACKSEN